MTFRMVGEPFVITRNEQGAIAAFANVCAYRGVEVASGEGNTKEFSCPYHGWLYDLNGRLVGAPYMKEAEGFDPGNCRLKPLQVGEWGGWVFVNFDANAESLESFLAEFADDVGFLQQENCRIGHKFTVDWKCNWKFVWRTPPNRLSSNSLLPPMRCGGARWMSGAIRRSAQSSSKMGGSLAKVPAA